MNELKLPADLENYLRDGKQLEYNSSQVEFGKMELKSLAELELRPVEVDLYLTPLAGKDLHHEVAGRYVVPAVILAELDYQFLGGQMVWLPSEGLYGMLAENDHTLRVFPGTVWSEIVSDPVPYLNAFWDLNTQLLTYFDPSERYKFEPYED